MLYRAFIVTVIMSFMASQIAFADCKWAEGVEKAADGTHYDYSKDCHKRVGNTVKELDKRKEQVKELNISLSDLTIAYDHKTKENEIYIEGMDKLDDKINTLEKLESKNKILWFIIGVGATGLAVWGAGQLK